MSGKKTDWAVYLQEGVIVTLTIRRYRGTTTVNFAELGIDDNSDAQLKRFLDEYIQPGQKRLIPPEIEKRLRSIETMARQNLKDNSFDCTAIASSGKFVPKTMYKSFKETNAELSDRFYEIRDEFASNYDKIISKVRRDYKILANELYMQAHPNAKSPSPKYVKSFVDEIVNQIPSKDEIVASFEYRTTLRRIPDYILNVIRQKMMHQESKSSSYSSSHQGPSSGKKIDSDDDFLSNHGEQEIQQKNPSNSSDIDNYNDDSNQSDEPQAVMNDETIRKGANELAIANGTGSILSAGPDGIDANASDASSYDEISVDIRNAMEEQAKEQADDFIDDIRIQVYDDAITGAASIASSIDKNNGKLVGRASIKAYSLIDNLDKMNFYGDENLNSLISQLRESLGEDSRNRNVTAVKAAAMALYDWASDESSKIRQGSVRRKADNAKKGKSHVKMAVPKNAKKRKIKQRS